MAGMRREKHEGQAIAQKFKAIIWDNAGVLGDAKCGSFVQLWAEKLEAPIEDIIRVLTSPEHDLLDLGEMSKEDYFDYVIRDIGLPPEMKARLDSITWDDMYADMELFEYIRQLHKTYTTAILSNFPQYLLDMERAASPWGDEIFDYQIVSCEVHLLKPDPRIYRLTLETIGCEPHEAVFIDDSPRNVEGAEKVGIRSILYQNREQVMEELDAILN